MTSRQTGDTPGHIVNSYHESCVSIGGFGFQVGSVGNEDLRDIQTQSRCCDKERGAPVPKTAVFSSLQAQNKASVQGSLPVGHMSSSRKSGRPALLESKFNFLASFTASALYPLVVR